MFMRKRLFFRSLEKSLKKISKKGLSREDFMLLLSTSTDPVILEELKVRGFIHQLVDTDLLKKDTVMIVPLHAKGPTIGFLKRESK